MDDDKTSSSPIRRSYVAAAVILLLLGAWIASGSFNRIEEVYALLGVEPAKGTVANPKAKPPGTPANASAKPTEIPTVRVRTITAEKRQQDLVIRGQTQALRKVQVRAETAGTVAAIRADKGSFVKAGDTICELKIDAREAMLKQARATAKQRELEYEASKTLQEKGFRSETSVAGDLAEYESAKAQVERMEKEFENTKIRAPFDGVVDDRMADVGDYLSPGQPCALVVDQDPFLVVGQVSEKDVVQVHIGDSGWAKLISGERVEGKVRFIAKSSDSATRTFRLELEVPNLQGLIRDGITADIHVTANMIEAHHITPAILGLDDRGVIGVRVVDQNKRVRFVPVQIVADGADGVWVTGLPRTVTIITVGQEYVTDGQQVNIVLDGNGSQS
ncbi:MAG: efflux RND transporter periplasmic adaptor subunit [Alphaproteobacteria bacterium]|nr:efflux RND transporter periplasmic adaptor subunit [Alphaproteobacteria bacterium]